ncbi:hypothetical protein F2Q70_00003392 [Brassica cretica]|uniref:Uncharacterized protein n=1 Tax=Brassica cretica TaxID=69181 RepID=A0A8S9IT86_BRACR|nr:hypothetical protein F2Q70_00003392 [Brassica cretica]
MMYESMVVIYTSRSRKRKKTKLDPMNPSKIFRDLHFVYLSLAPFRQNHRVSLSLLDDSAGDFFICQRSDEGFGVSLIGLGVSVSGLHVSLALLDDSTSLSLSLTTLRLSRSLRWLTLSKNHSTSLSGLWLSSTKSNRKIDGSRDMKVLQRRGLWSRRIKRQWLFQCLERIDYQWLGTN